MCHFSLDIFFCISIRPESAYTQKDGVALPAMKSALSSKLAERRRRTQILQKARFTDKEVLH